MKTRKDAHHKKDDHHHKHKHDPSLFANREPEDKERVHVVQEVNVTVNNAPNDDQEKKDDCLVACFKSAFRK